MSKRLTYNYVKKFVEENNYKLLSLEYRDAHSKLEMVCDKGHIVLITWTSFKSGVLTLQY